MTLGEKIRQARLEAGLSQRQLCGDAVTRNMLSQIENGAARPSMKTLSYFAARLGKSVSFFLEEETPSPQQAALTAARQALDEGKAAYAAQLLEQTEEWSDPWLRRQRLLLLGAAAPRRCREICAQLPGIDDELMLRAAAALEEGDRKRAAALLDAAEDREQPQWNFLRGRVFKEQGDYAAAVACYKMAEEKYPDKCAAALEVCYRELGDFKQAYFYACKGRK